MDFFSGLPVTVEIDKDLAFKKQLLDVVIVRKTAEPLACRLPDGFDNLAAHNLISFKSYQDTLDGWTLSELVGHYVNYRKQESPSMQELLPEADFRLFAVSVRFPARLAQQVELTRLWPGVYEVRHFTGALRVVVIHQLPREEQNALLLLFSAQQEALEYAVAHYARRSEETSTLMLQLWNRYQAEGMTMNELERMARETVEQLLRNMPMEERLKGVPLEALEERVKSVTLEERLKGMPPEERLKLLKALLTDDLLAIVDPDKREALLRLKDKGSSANPG
jgi:hypothetical protein